MTVKELKEYLNNFDENMIVQFWDMYEDCYQDVDESTIREDDRVPRLVIE